MDRAVKKIRPADVELSQVQENLANHLQQVVDVLSSVQNTRSLYMGSYGSFGGKFAVSDFPCGELYVNPTANTYNLGVYGEVMANSGSVRAIKMYSPDPFSGGTITATLYRNGAPTKTSVTTLSQRALSSYNPGEMFAVGDLLQVWVRASAATVQAKVICHVDVESV